VWKPRRSSVSREIRAIRKSLSSIVRALDRLAPVLEAAAYLLVLNIGIELLLEDLWHIKLNDAQKFIVSAGTLGLTLLYGRSTALQRIGRYLTWLKRVLGVVSLLFLWTLKPIGWFFGGFVGVTRVLAVLFATRIRLVRDARRVSRDVSNPETK